MRVPESAVASEPGRGYVRAIRTPGGGSVLTHARANSPLRIFFPKVGRAVWVVTTTLGGGLVGGDDIMLSINVEQGATALLTSQASTKVYRSRRMSSQRVVARVADGALLVSLPDPVVAFAGASFEQRQEFELENRASLLALDWVISGRQASGERWAFDRYCSRFGVARGGRPIFFDNLRLSQSDGPVADRMRRFSSYAIAVLTGPVLTSWTDRLLETISSEPIDSRADLVVSAMPVTDRQGVVVRVAGVSVEAAAATLRDLLRPIAEAAGEDPWARRW